MRAVGPLHQNFCLIIDAVNGNFIELGPKSDSFVGAVNSIVLVIREKLFVSYQTHSSALIKLMVRVRDEWKALL